MTARALLLISLFPAALSLSAQQSPENPVPTITTTLRQVVLDVVVTDKDGHPVKGLKPSDFAVTEDGVPQVLAGFTEQVASNVTPPPPPEPKLPPNTFINHAPLTGNGAVTVILFDELSFTDTAYARDQVSSFMKTLTPGMPICIFKLDWQGLHLIQDFTTDPQTLRQAVNSKRNDMTLHPSVDLWQPALVGDAMNELARYLSGFSGRKNLIWFTDGQPPELSNRLFPDITSLFDDRDHTVDVLTLSRVALYPIDARGLVVNARRGFDILVEDGELAQVADATGGHAFYSTNGFKQAVAEVVANGSNYYTLAYNPNNQNWNGSYRKIKLQLANTAYSDAAVQSAPAKPAWPFRLEYRQGYYATQFTPHSPYTAGSGTRRMISYSPKGDPANPTQSPPLRLAMAFGAVAPFQILFQAHVTPELVIDKLKRHEQLPKYNYLDAKWQHSPYRNYRIHYSVDAHDIQVKQSVSGYTANLQFIAVAYNDDGAIVNSLITTVPLELDLNQYLQVINNGIGLDQTIAIPTKGDFFLRLGVHDLNSGRVGALEIPAESIQLTPTLSPAANSN